MPANQYPATMDSLAAMLKIMTSELRSSRIDDSGLRTLIKSFPLRALLPIPSGFISPSIRQPIIKQKKRNERTRQQHKRKKALHVTVQPSVKEVEHTVRVEHGNKPGEHVVLQRIKLVPWDWSTTSLWCWYAVIPWDGMTMMLWCGASGMPRIGIG